MTGKVRFCTNECENEVAAGISAEGTEVDSEPPWEEVGVSVPISKSDDRRRAAAWSFCLSGEGEAVPVPGDQWPPPRISKSDIMSWV